jgi:hypothetical protein
MHEVALEEVFIHRSSSVQSIQPSITYNLTQRETLINLKPIPSWACLAATETFFG